jgi:hypothetical protein
MHLPLEIKKHSHRGQGDVRNLMFKELKVMRLKIPLKYGSCFAVSFRVTVGKLRCLLILRVGPYSRYVSNDVMLNN